MSPLSILTVHAHPDDEASKGSATVARYAAAGVRSTLVCCTGGEEGDILNPALDRPEVRADLAAVRREELARAAEAIGYDTVHLLGYRDSGMADSPTNDHPECFAQAPLEEAVERLVRIIRAERPQVVVTYGDDQQGYRHPDHLKVHDISRPAFDLAADPSAFPDAGAAWQPLKLYYTTWSRARIAALHQRYLDLGRESPYDDRWFTRPSDDHRITTRVDIRHWYEHRDAALRAHATQVDPNSAFWFGLPTEEAADAYPWDDYILAHSHVDTEVPEQCLFDGIAVVDVVTSASRRA